MDIWAATGDDRMLRRVIALLVALAVVAERTADRSWPIRLLVLWLLRRAEARAADFAFDATGLPPHLLEGMTAVGDGAADALGLSARFRALAALLAMLLPGDLPAGRRSVRRALASGYAAPRRCHPSGDREPIPVDTS